MEEREYRLLCGEFKTGYENVIKHIQGEVQTSYVEQRKIEDFVYFKVDEIGYYDEMTGTMEKNLYGLHSVGVAFTMVFQFDGEKIQMFIGANRSSISKIYNILNGKYRIFSSNMESEYLLSSYEIFRNDCYNYAGVLRGNFIAENVSEQKNTVIDQIVSGCFGTKFSVVIIATPLEKRSVVEISDAWNDLLSTGEMIKSRQISERDERTVVAYNTTDYNMLSYLKIVETYYNIFSKGIHCGLWNTTMKYYTEYEETAEEIAGIITANTFSKELNTSFHRIKIQKSSMRYCDDFLENMNYIEVGKGIEIGFPVFSSLLSNEELGMVMELPQKDIPGIAIKQNVSFDVNRKEDGGISLGNILYRGKATCHEYTFDRNEFIRHTLVVGLTGSGKTNTLKNILVNLYNDNEPIPFMVIEPAKREYWELYKYGCDNLNIFPLGSKECNFAINPFQRTGKVPLQTHIDFVFAAFKASFIMYTPMPYVLEQAIYSIYEDCGWNIEEDENRYGELYPTIENLYYKIPSIVEKMGYEGKMKSDLISSLQARINTLRVGIKGNVLNVKKSFPMENLLNTNTIIELENIADDEVKAFIMSLLLINVNEWRMSQKDTQKEIRHLFLIEEAHRLLKNIKSGTGENADPRGNAVEFFCNMLAELRSKGQAFIIAEQIPSKLAPDVMDNTNLKIVHRLVTENERNLMGKSMNMNEKQIGYLSSLEQGVAAVYGEGDYSPKLIKPEYIGNEVLWERKEMRHDEVCQICNSTLVPKEENQCKLEYGCTICPFSCKKEKRKVIYEYVSKEIIQEKAEILKSNFNIYEFENILLEIMSELKRQTDEYEKYAFCFVKELVEKMRIDTKEINMVYDKFYLLNRELC